MSDLTATGCGCGTSANNGCGCGNNSIIWIILLLSCCGGCGCGGSLFGGNDNALLLRKWQWFRRRMRLRMLIITGNSFHHV